MPDKAGTDVKPGKDIYSIRKNPLSSAAGIIVILVFIATIFGPVLSPHDPVKTDMSLRLAAPSFQYPFGNDTLGRCIFSRILSGARMSIGLGISVVAISCLLGILVGLIAGYKGGFIDESLMRIADIFLSLPEIIAAMTLAGIMGPGTFNLIFALSITGWMRYARLVRGITLSVREQDYVKSAQYSGVSTPIIIFRHILPANIGSVIVLATTGMAKAIVSVSALGFLGFGVQPPAPEWGTLLMEGKDYILSSPHLSIFPGIAIMLSALAFNLLGDKLRDTWSPDR
jgi:peptide/nickel transport system permease protein